MAVLVDYRCARCAGVTEQRVPAPPPASLTCPACGGTARRVFAPAGVIGRSRPPSGSPGPPASGTGAPLCLRNPDVPGLCHMTPSAARAWVARARGDNRALDRELERQERSAAGGSAAQPVAAHHHLSEKKDSL